MLGCGERITWTHEGKSNQIKQCRNRNEQCKKKERESSSKR